MFILFVKGLVIGIGKVIPGVSGSIISILLGVYNDGVTALKNPFNKSNLIFLFISGTGILFSIIFGSKLIIYFMINHYFMIMLLFSSLVFGTIPIIQKEVKFNLKNIFIILVISISFLYISFCSFSSVYVYTGSVFDFYFLILVGFIEVSTMIIPGISGTVLLMMLGVYSLVTETMSRLFILSYFKENIMIILPMLLGMIIGFITVINLVSFLLKKHKDISFVIIYSFCITSFIILLKKTFEVSFSLFDLVVGIFIFIFGFILSRSLENINNK